MQKAVLLHGTDGDSGYNWFPWVKDQLEQRGYEVFAPTLPQNNTPNRAIYEDFLRNSNWDFSDNLIIGHSSGATTVLNLLSTDWFPKVKRTILVGLFLNERLLASVDWYKPGQFDDLFPENGYDIDKLRRKADSYVFIHGDDDPYCSIDDTKQFAKEFDEQVHAIRQGMHLSSNRKELPEILPFLDIKGE